ncbi:TetR family transcriptional regulator [Roseiarcus fermentans]|uniref:TetR family transcriptional regulator n=1 Tax=Roseiarcus fermentans TaxID=1473586 RepID=A0A366FSW3_9HYPH|nr:TetR/AcrR family transcriptional regulator [Roseiarcus fermentans]RBP17236.1 TetR family transcriptional regulator [Roseiarcus fermentans]
MVTKVAGTIGARNPAVVRARVLAALGAIIERDGLARLGVNALAREAGCDKVLIYRYFGDLDGVCREFAQSRDFWWTLDDLVQGLDPAGLSRTRALQVLMRRHAAAIRSRPTTLAILAHELTERSTLAIALEEVRETRTLELFAWIGERFDLPAAVDLPAVSLLLGSAVNYLAARGRDVSVMGGVALRSDADWERILSAIDALIAGVVPPQ